MINLNIQCVDDKCLINKAQGESETVFQEHELCSYTDGGYFSANKMAFKFPLQTHL